MAIVQTLTKSDFVQAFTDCGRSDNFTIEAREAIFDYIEEYSNDTGENVELDVIAICCDWREEPWQEIVQSCGLDLSHCETDEERIDAVEEYLNDETISFRLSDDSFVFVCF